MWIEIGEPSERKCQKLSKFVIFDEISGNLSVYISQKVFAVQLK